MLPRKAARNRWTSAGCEIFMQNSGHPSLRFKKLSGFERAWSVRIGSAYRAVGERHGDTIYWTWIGTHNEFDNLFS